MKENSREEDIALIEKSLCDKDTIIQYHYWVGTDFLNAVERIVADYKRVLKENETYKKQYFCLIDKIENKIDKFDYEFEKAKRKNYQERADYYWDLIRNFKKLLEEE